MSLALDIPEVTAKSETGLSVILRKSERHADKTALHWLDSACEVVHEVTYRELATRTLRLATALLEGALRIGKGDRAVLCYQPGLEFIEAFLACLRAGVIAGE